MSQAAECNMTNIFQVSHILQFILRAFSVILLVSYMTFSFPLSFPVSRCNIQSAMLRVQYGKCCTVFCRSDCRYFYVLAINTIKCTTKVFCKVRKNGNAVKYFRKKFHIRCLTALCMCLWTCLMNSFIICFLHFFAEMWNCRLQSSLSIKIRRREGISSAW